MLIRSWDCETTGMPPDAALCEVGWSDLWINGDDTAIDPPVAYLCNPGRPMPCEARAIHHIGDRELAGAWSPDMALIHLNEDVVDVWCAHNAAFEQSFFTGKGKPWICTLKVARRLWPDSPSHSNQCLRYFLGIKLDDADAMPPHRAGPDAFVTAHILKAALALTTVADMIQWTSEPSLLPKITFGKHRGKKWPEAPRDYLEWIVAKSDLDADTKFTAKHHLEKSA